MNVIIKVTMKKLIVFMGCSLMAALVAMTSCVRDNGDVIVPDFDEFGATVELSVPCGTKSVFVEYQAKDGTTTTDEVTVSPQIVAPTDGKNIEPFGLIKLYFSADVETRVSVYYLAGDIGSIATKADDSKIERKYVLTGQPLVGIKADYVPTDATPVRLNEPGAYQSQKDDQIYYHSSGVVMFEDSWPSIERNGAYDTDFDDAVIDYDFEAKIMPDSRLEKDNWREQLKVVIHLRAVGSQGNTCPYRVGVKLEGFDQQYVEKVEQYFTLDSYANPHGNLPAFTESTIQRNSGHYEDDPKNPVVEMAHIFTLNQERAGKGAGAEYTYTNNGFTNHTVFNLTYGFKDQDKSQYAPELETMELPYAFNNIMKQKMYNCIPGYMNVAGGLVTYTVIYTMKNRAYMTQEEKDAARENMINAVIQTTKQNFYIITKEFTPVGLKGYEPVLLHSESQSPYNKKLQSGVADGNINANNPYDGKGGMVWGVKCPTLTKHVWNKLYFSAAYPHYVEWLESGGKQHNDWYYNDVDGRYLVCWW